MSAAFIPMWILGAPVVGIVLLTLLFQGGTSAGSYDRSSGRHPSTPSHPGSTSNQFRESAPDREYSATLESISRLSENVPVGMIAEYSGHVSPGAISRLSGPKSPGAISRLSGHVSPGAISRLSGHKAPGAISSLSAPRPVGSIASLSRGWFVSSLLGLPLLTRSQKPIESDETLLTRGG